MLDEHMGPIKKYSILTVGAVVLALANYVFKFPNHFSFGGVAGFAVILSGMFGGSASTYTFVINMLLLLIAFPILGKEVAMRSFYVSIVFSGVLEVVQYVYPIDKPITNQPVLELVFSFMLLAVCSAIFFFMDASSGGTDIIALILKKYTNVSIGRGFCRKFSQNISKAYLISQKDAGKEENLLLKPFYLLPFLIK